MDLSAPFQESFNKVIIHKHIGKINTNLNGSRYDNDCINRLPSNKGSL